jgi:fructosamine-3-kinase
VSLAASLQAAIRDTLREAGDPSPIRVSEVVGGGDINRAARVATGDGMYFVKWHTAPPPDFFKCEARGVSLIGENGSVRVPHVIGHGTVTGERTAFLILEWIDQGSKTEQAAEILGRRLAEMQRVRQPRYGLDYDNYVGSTPQPNTPSESWLEFFGTRRLGAQRDLAAQSGRLPAQRARLLDRLLGSLERWIDDSACQPSLLHGDLWGGNWMASAAGEPVLIDPAVYMGDREAELAVTTLFGGFPRSFYAAYNEVFPVSPGHEEREPIYQLYHLLNHLNLFGEGYGGSVDGTLRRCVG